MPDKCPNCGIDLQSNAQFCRRCGFKVSAPLVSPSAAEATTRNLPNIPMTDPRQTGGFGTSQLPMGQAPAAYPPPPMPQPMSYMPPMPRRTGGGKAVIFFFVVFAVITLCLVGVASKALQSLGHKGPRNIAGSPVTSGSATLQKTFKLAPDAQISLSNISGKIDIKSTDGDSVEFRASRQDGSGPALEDVLNISSSDKSFSVNLRGNNLRGSIDYEVLIPKKMGELRLNSVSGEINVKGIESKIHANSTSGDMDFSDISGSLETNSTSGDVTAEFKTPPTGDLAFHSVSGDFDIKFAAAPDL